MLNERGCESIKQNAKVLCFLFLFFKSLCRFQLFIEYFSLRSDANSSAVAAAIDGCPVLPGGRGGARRLLGEICHPPHCFRAGPQTSSKTSLWAARWAQSPAETGIVQDECVQKRASDVGQNAL